LRTLTGYPSLNRGFDCFIGGVKFNFDFVTRPAVPSGELALKETWIHNQLTTGSLFPIVQFKTKNPGAVGITTGDSHHQGTTATDQVAGYLYRATTTLGSGYVGRVPFGMVNCAFGGARSNQFFPRFEGLLSAVEPSYAVLPGWTYTDCNGAVHADATAVERFTQRLFEVVDLCRRSNVVPIVLTPLPRSPASMTSVQLAPWRALREKILDMRLSGIPVLDVTALVGAKSGGEFTGTYLPSLSNDEMHPNDSGHFIIASRLVDLLQATCGV